MSSLRWCSASWPTHVCFSMFSTLVLPHVHMFPLESGDFRSWQIKHILLRFWRLSFKSPGLLRDLCRPCPAILFVLANHLKGQCFTSDRNSTCLFLFTRLYTYTYIYINIHIYIYLNLSPIERIISQSSVQFSLSKTKCSARLSHDPWCDGDIRFPICLLWCHSLSCERCQSQVQNHVLSYDAMFHVLLNNALSANLRLPTPESLTCWRLLGSWLHYNLQLGFKLFGDTCRMNYHMWAWWCMHVCVHTHTDSDTDTDRYT